MVHSRTGANTLSAGESRSQSNHTGALSRCGELPRRLAKLHKISQKMDSLRYSRHWTAGVPGKDQCGCHAKNSQVTRGTPERASKLGGELHEKSNSAVG